MSLAPRSHVFEDVKILEDCVESVVRFGRELADDFRLCLGVFREMKCHKLAQHGESMEGHHRGLAVNFDDDSFDRRDLGSRSDSDYEVTEAVLLAGELKIGIFFDDK